MIASASMVQTVKADAFGSLYALLNGGAKDGKRVVSGAASVPVPVVTASL